MLNDIDPDPIALCDQEAAHGNLPAPGQSTHRLNIGLRESGRPCVGEDLLRWTYSKLPTRRSA